MIFPANHSTPQTQPNNNLEIPYPSLFWSCPDADAGLDMIRNPFDRRDLGFDGLFPPATLYYHIPPQSPNSGKAGGKLSETLVVPTLQKESAGWVAVATAVVVVVGFGWVLGRLVFGAGKETKAKAEKEKQKKKQ
jgi:hypothetical protein